MSGGLSHKLVVYSWKRGRNMVRAREGWEDRTASVVAYTRPGGVVVQHCNRDCEVLSNAPLLTVELWTVDVI